MKDFGRSWRDGFAFNAIIHNIRPELVDMKKVRQSPARANLEHAFNTAENHLGIPRLLDPEGRSEFCIMLSSSIPYHIMNSFHYQ